MAATQTKKHLFDGPRFRTDSGGLQHSSCFRYAIRNFNEIPFNGFYWNIR